MKKTEKNKARNVNNYERAGKYVVAVLASVLNGTPAPQLPDTMSWKTVYHMAKFHSVEAMTYYGVKDFIPSTDEIYEKWKKSRDQNLLQSLLQLKERDEIFQKLYEEGIRFLPLKGCKMKELYKQIEFRQMSDLDILIEPHNAEKVKEIMELLGYETKAFERSNHDQYFKAPYITVEIHRQLLPDRISSHSYYDCIWEKVLPDEAIPGGYKLSVEDAYIYHLIHFQKHFSGNGSGIRSFMDIYVYQQNFAMDIHYIEQECKRLKINDFRQKVERLSKIWFSPGSKQNKTLYTPELKQLEHNVFLSGVYGSRSFVKIRRMDENQISYILKRVFMSRKDFASAFPITKKYPVLIPVFWFYRICNIFIRRREVIKLEIEIFLAKGKRLFQKTRKN